MANSTSAKLAKQIWAIANALRGNMDASKFKDYILGVIFYRYLSAHTESYMDDLLRDDGVTYRQALENPELAVEVKEWSIDNLGYFIKPDDLFDSLVAKINEETFSIEDFERAISNLTESTIGQESEAAFANLFDAMDLRDSDLGKEVSDRTKLISTVILKIYDTPFAKDSDAGDVLGTAYMILIGLFQSNAGKKGGEFFTPTCVSTLLAQLTTIGLNEVKNVSDGCAGSGSLLLEVARHLPSRKVSHYYAQEKVGTTYNLLRMNLIMHGVDYKRFTVFNDDTLTHDNFYENGLPVKFDIQVENPPYSIPNTASGKEFLEDPRYKSAGVLAPQSKADLAFVESIVYHMADDGRAAVLLPHGVLFRSGAEHEIRKYLIDNLNVIDAIIGLPANMFHGTSIPVCILLLKKSRNGNSDNILFVDASKHFVKDGKQNALRASDVKRIVDCVRERRDISGFSRKVKLSEICDTEGNNYNLNIPRYVDSMAQVENWDIYSLINGGVPASEVDELAPYFEVFEGLKRELYDQDGYTYQARGNVRETVGANASVREYIKGYELMASDMRNLLEDTLITHLEEVDTQAAETLLTDRLFELVDATPFVDRYDAYQLLSDAWFEISADLDLIKAEGREVVSSYEKNMVLKKNKDKELVEEQDGWVGRVLPFELVQEVYLSDDLAELRALKTAVSEAQSYLDELKAELSDDDKDYEVNGAALYDKDKGDIVTKVLNAAVAKLKKDYGKDLDFDEGTSEYKIVQLHDARAALTAAKRKLTNAKNKIDPKTMEILDSMSEQQALDMLRLKWIEPYIGSVSSLARNAVIAFAQKIESLTEKYEATYAEDETEIEQLESELASMLGSMRGNESDEAGVADWLKFLGGAI